MPTLVLKGRAFDGEVGHPRAVVVVDADTGLITGFGEPGEVEEPKDAKKVEVDDATILPGLIDAHVHFYSSQGTWPTNWSMVPDTLAVLRAARDLKVLLRSGFTAVRELGSKGGAHLAQAVEEGAIEGPEVVSCARALAQTGEDDDPRVFPLDVAQGLASYSYFCDGPWECRRAVRKVVRDGGRVVKLYASGRSRGGRVRPNFTAEELEAIVTEAHTAGLKVAAHAHGEEALANVVRAGADSIEHGSGLTPGIADEISKRGIYYVPTLMTYKTLMRGDLNERVRDQMRKHLGEDMQLAKERRLKVVSGSDVVGDTERPHGRNFEEVALIAESRGNEDALAAATSRAALCLDIPDTGRLREGFRADILVVRGDPVADIQALAPENVDLVFKRGRLAYSRS